LNAVTTRLEECTRSTSGKTKVQARGAAQVIGRGKKNAGIGREILGGGKKGRRNLKEGHYAAR